MENFRPEPPPPVSSQDTSTRSSVHFPGMAFQICYSNPRNLSIHASCRPGILFRPSLGTRHKHQLAVRPMQVQAQRLDHFHPIVPGSGWPRTERASAPGEAFRPRKWVPPVQTCTCPVRRCRKPTARISSPSGQIRFRTPQCRPPGYFAWDRLDRRIRAIAVRNIVQGVRQRPGHDLCKPTIEWSMTQIRAAFGKSRHLPIRGGVEPPRGEQATDTCYLLRTVYNYAT